MNVDNPIKHPLRGSLIIIIIIIIIIITVARAVHWNLCKNYQMPCSNKWYEHQPQPVTENKNAKLLWNYSNRTDRVIPAHRSDLTLVGKTNNKVSLIDVAVPWDSIAEQKKQEKKNR